MAFAPYKMRARRILLDGIELRITILEYYNNAPTIFSFVVCKKASFFLHTVVVVAVDRRKAAALLSDRKQNHIRLINMIRGNYTHTHTHIHYREVIQNCIYLRLLVIL